MSRVFLGRLPYLALVGGAATVLYASVAWAGTTLLALPAPLASVGAYVLSSFLSYAGHRNLTFRSRKQHLETAPRFVALTAAGYFVSLVAPWLLTVRLGAPPLVAIALTCIAVPALSVLGLARLVFRTALLSDGSVEHTGDRS